MKLLSLGLLLFAVGAWGQPDAGEGKAIYRSNCAFCHGLTGGGGRGPALSSGRFVHGSTDDDLKQVIQHGVPGTTMPAFEGFASGELNELVAFVRGLSRGAAGRREAVTGDATRGRGVYQRSGCAACHQVGREGSVFGPDLTRIGAGRSPAYLRESLVDPSADIPLDYEGVTVVAGNGERVGGVRVNEDTFSVQLRDLSQNFRMFRKQDVKEVVYDRKSLMPEYKSLAPADLNDLVAYLVSLKGPTGAGSEVRKAEGIR
jgi:putative heme-binding domain-containing protein